MKNLNDSSAQVKGIYKKSFTSYEYHNKPLQTYVNLHKNQSKNTALCMLTVYLLFTAKPSVIYHIIGQNFENLFYLPFKIEHLVTLSKFFPCEIF